MGYDCVHIPGAEKEATATKMVGSNICGRSNGLVTTSGNSIAVNPTMTMLNSKSICCEIEIKKLLNKNPFLFFRYFFILLFTFSPFANFSGHPEKKFKPLGVA